MAALHKVRSTRVRLSSRLPAVERSLFVVGARATMAETGILFLLGTVAAFYRLGGSAGRGTPWAEDGQVFLQQAYHSGSLRVLSVQYAGYLCTGPRLATAAAMILPLNWQGLGLEFAAAAVVGLVGVLTYAATATHIPPRWARLLLVACVVAVPVGPEVTGNVANLQWFLMFGAGIALFWTPSSWFGWTMIAVAVFVAVTSSPFGFLIFVGAALRYVVQRNHAVLIVGLVATVAFLIQTAAMIHAPSRTSSHEFGPVVLVRGYTSRVLGDGVLGVGRLSVDSPHGGYLAGVVVFALTAVLIALAVINKQGGVGFAVSLLVLSVITYLLPVASSASKVNLPFYAGRYYVTPTLFLMAALISLTARATSVPIRADHYLSWVGTVIGIVLIGGAVYGLVDSYGTSGYYGRDTGQSWQTSVDQARKACVSMPNSAPVDLAELPPGWHVELTCGIVSGG